MARDDTYEDDEDAPAPKRRRMRLIPLTATMMTLVFIIKLNDVYIGSRELSELYTAHEAQAEDKKPDADAAPKDAAATPADAAKPADGAAPVTDAVKATDTPAVGKDGKPLPEEKTFGTGKTSVKDIEAMKARSEQPQYTQTELDLLQNLSKRRDELDQREKDLDIKAKVLDASEKRITDKVEEMKTLQAELGKVLAQYNQKQDDQIKSLVKIYENMKPEDAANIFNQMEMPILLDVIGKMSERKVALVLANMDPKRAKDITQELADRRKRLAASAAAADVTGGSKP